MEPSKELSGARVRLRLSSAADLDQLAGWFGDERFVRHWGGRPLSRETVAADYIGARRERLPDGRQERVESFIIEHEGVAVGYIQSWSQHEQEGGLDIVLAPEFQGRGFGSDAIQTLAQYLRQQLGWRKITVDPAAGNARAIHFFQKCGFVIERDWPDHPDGPSLLMALA